MNSPFQLAQWQVIPKQNALTDGVRRQFVEPRAMDVLCALCERHGQVVSSEELLALCWGSTDGGDNPLHKAITQLRRALGDASAKPRFIETIRKRGYRLIAPLVLADEAKPASWHGGSPFRGLEAFDERHAAIFYGRARAAAALLDTLAAQARAGCPMVLVLGPSGSGKTSLIRAGLLPQLTAAHADPALASSCALYFDCGDLGSGDLFQALGSVMLDAEADGASLFEGESGASLGHRLEHESELPALRLAGRPRPRLLLCIDRFEALFRLPASRAQERLRFITLLEAMAHSRAVLLVMACRNDFYPQLTAESALMALKLRGGHFDLHAPTREEIGQIVRNPATAAGLQFGADGEGVRLDELLCNAAAASPDALPLLQYCLQELYRQRGAGDILHVAAYEQMGGLEGAIGARADMVVAGLSEAQAAALPRVLSQLVSVARDDLAVTSRRGAWAALQGEAEEELVRALVEARLFVSELHGNDSSFAVAHEAILRRWPRAVAWIESHRQALQLRASVSDQAARWQVNACARDLLLPRGSQVRQAAELLDAGVIALTGNERDFVLTSLQRARRGERLRLLVTGGVFILAVLAMALGLAARSLQQDAEQHRSEAEGLMAYMLGDFVERLRPLGRLDLLDSVSSRALSYLSAGRKSGGETPEALAQRAKALQVIAEVKIARADPSAATAALLASQAILGQQLAENGTDKATLKLMGGNAFWLGQIQLDQRDWPQSEKYFRQYQQFSARQAAADPADPDGQIEQSYAHNSLGSLLLLRGDLSQAASEFEFSVALKTRLLEHAPDNRKWQADLANSVSWLASAQTKLGKLEAAMALYERELKLMHALHEAEPENGIWSQRLALAFWRQADLQLALGQIKRAETGYLAAQTLLLSVVKRDSGNRSWQASLYAVQLRLLKLRAATAGAVSTLQSLRGLREALLGLSRLEPKKKNLLRLVAVSEQHQAEALRELGKPVEAEALMRSALGRLNNLHAELPADQGILESLAEALLSQASQDAEHSQPEAALQACRAASAVLAPGAANSADYRLLVPYLKSQLCINESVKVKILQNSLNAIGYADVITFRHIPRPTTSGRSER